MNRRTIIVSVVLTVGGLVAGVGLATTSAVANSVPGQSSTSPNPTYRVNSLGETYGPALGTLPQLQLPDLIPVTATNGESGYVKKSDLMGPSPTLQQVLSYPRDDQGNFVGPPTSSSMRVYSRDGTTQVGVFTGG